MLHNNVRYFEHKKVNIKNKNVVQNGIKQNEVCVSELLKIPTPLMTSLSSQSVRITDLIHELNASLAVDCCCCC